MPKKKQIEVDLENPVRHPLSAIFEDLHGVDMDELKDSIEEVGVLQPIIVDGEGRIVDGWQRITAVQQLTDEGLKGIELEFETVDNVDGYVWSNNMTRRHMTPNERAKAILKMDDWCTQNIDGYEPRTLRELAEQSGTSTATIARARKEDSDDEPDEEKAPRMSKADQLEQELIAVKQERDAARDKVGELQERIGIMEESAKAEGKSMTELKKFIQLQTKNRTLTDTVNTQKKRIGDLERQLKGAKSQLKKLK